MDRYLTDRDVWKVDPREQLARKGMASRDRLMASALNNAFTTELVSSAREVLDFKKHEGKDGMIAGKPQGNSG